MDGEDRELFERSLRHAVERHTGASLDAALDEIGWADALEDDRRTAVATLFELQGGATVTSSALDRVLTDVLGLERRPAAAVVLPAIGRWDPPGTLGGGALHVAGLITVPDATGLESLTVVTTSGDEELVISVPTSALTLTPVDGMDPDLGLVSVTGAGVGIPTEPQIASGSWTTSVAAGRLAVAHELVGASRRMLELAVTHALERVQFGRPISSFQAVRHRLAETLVAIEMADAVLDAAWLDGSPDTAAMAKAVAGRQARITARHCQQVLAGIGFTTEHPLHLSIRRTFVLDGLLGTAATLTSALGHDLIATRRLPPLLPL